MSYCPIDLDYYYTAPILFVWLPHQVLQLIDLYTTIFIGTYASNLLFILQKQILTHNLTGSRYISEPKMFCNLSNDWSSHKLDLEQLRSLDTCFNMSAPSTKQTLLSLVDDFEIVTK